MTRGNLANLVQLYESKLLFLFKRMEFLLQIKNTIIWPATHNGTVSIPLFLLFLQGPPRPLCRLFLPKNVEFY